MTERLPQSTAELITDIQREWNALWQVVERLTPEQMTAPDAGGWSPKDNLAHLAQWLTVLMGYRIDGRPAHEVMGVSSDVIQDWNFETMNAALLEQSRGQTAEAVQDSLKQAYAALIEKLRSTPFSELIKPPPADHAEQPRLLERVLGYTTEHFAEHRATIEKAL